MTKKKDEPINSDLSIYEIVVEMTEFGKPLAKVHFNPITREIHAILADSFRMDRAMGIAGLPDENVDDFLIRVAARGRVKLGISHSDFFAKHAEKWKAYELGEIERIAAEKPADQRSYADGYRPPGKGRKKRPKAPARPEAIADGEAAGSADPMGGTDAQGAAGEDSGDSRFATFDGVY